jgi:hypothetical protein
VSAKLASHVASDIVSRRSRHGVSRHRPYAQESLTSLPSPAPLPHFVSPGTQCQRRPSPHPIPTTKATMSILSVPAPAYPSPPSRGSSSPEPLNLHHSISVSSSSAMGGSTNNTNTVGVDGIGQLTYQRAIDIARNTEGDLDASVTAYLEEAVTEINNNLESYPDSYLLSKDEFAVFNYFRSRFQGELAERAVDRYWRSTHAGADQQQQADRS